MPQPERRLLVLVALCALVAHVAAGADRAPGRQPSAAALPPPSITRHTLQLPAGALRLTATVEALPLDDAGGSPQAEIVTTAYMLDGADPATRPVTFVVNGGPGFASAWLQLGALGPWRLQTSHTIATPSTPPVTQPNRDTWLDFTDLVFIDPAGTGYSRIDATGDAAKKFWTVDGDITEIAETIRMWLVRHGRLASPKFFAGESYGGFRGPRVLRELEQHQSVGLSGLVLISPVLDFGGHSAAFDPFSWAAGLPTMTAVARAFRTPASVVSRETLADAESYASGDYLLDLVRGLRDEAAVQRISTRVAALTGLDVSLVRRYDGRVPPRVFLREIDRAHGRVGSVYDGTVTGIDPFPSSEFDRADDRIVEGQEPAVSSAMMDLYAGPLNWRPDAQYLLGNDDAFRHWDYGHDRDRVEAMTALREGLALDPQLHVLIEHGLFDFVAPYFRTKLLLDTIPGNAGGDRVRLAVHPGGHMLYTEDASRAALHDEARELELQR